MSDDDDDADDDADDDDDAGTSLGGRKYRAEVGKVVCDTTLLRDDVRGSGDRSDDTPTSSSPSTRAFSRMMPTAPTEAFPAVPLLSLAPSPSGAAVVVVRALPRGMSGRRWALGAFLQPLPLEGWQSGDAPMEYARSFLWATIQAATPDQWWADAGDDDDDDDGDGEEGVPHHHEGAQSVYRWPMLSPLSMVETVTLLERAISGKDVNRVPDTWASLRLAEECLDLWRALRPERPWCAWMSLRAAVQILWKTRLHAADDGLTPVRLVLLFSLPFVVVVAVAWQFLSFSFFRATERDARYFVVFPVLFPAQNPMDEASHATVVRSAGGTQALGTAMVAMLHRWELAHRVLDVSRAEWFVRVLAAARHSLLPRMVHRASGAHSETVEPCAQLIAHRNIALWCAQMLRATDSLWPEGLVDAMRAETDSAALFWRQRAPEAWPLSGQATDDEARFRSLEAGIHEKWLETMDGCVLSVPRPWQGWSSSASSPGRSIEDADLHRAADASLSPWCGDVGRAADSAGIANTDEFAVRGNWDAFPVSEEYDTLPPADRALLAVCRCAASSLKLIEDHCLQCSVCDVWVAREVAAARGTKEDHPWGWVAEGLTGSPLGAVAPACPLCGGNLRIASA